MKKLKIKKRMTSFLMLAVMVVSIIGVIPKTIAYANDDVEIKDYTFGICSADNPDTDMSLEKFAVQESAWRNIAFVNVEKGQYVVASIVKGVSIDNTIHAYRYLSKGDSTYLYDESSFRGVIQNYTYNNTDYCFVVRYGTYSPSSFVFKVNKAMCFTTTENVASSPSTWIRDYIGDALPTTFTQVSDEGMDSSKIPDGSTTNPIRDKSVGYPDIYDYKFLISSPSSRGDDGEHGEWDKLKNADYIKWKSKSTTGFNLTSPDSKYKNVYIQAKIVSRFQYNDSFWGNGEWHNYDNYGEEGYFDFINPSDKELTVTFQQLTELLPKTHAEKHHFKKYNFDYDYYFRIVYTRADDLKVIPTYYSGGWRRISCHSNNGKHDENGEGENSSAIITDGDDEGGKWKTDEDSKDNDKNIDNGTGEGSDLDDAKDDANNKKKDTSSGSLDIDSVKGFMNEVGNVPKAIGKLFSFLPDWVTTFIGFGFVVLVALMIIKAIRG